MDGRVGGCQASVEGALAPLVGGGSPAETVWGRRDKGRGYCPGQRDPAVIEEVAVLSGKRQLVSALDGCIQR